MTTLGKYDVLFPLSLPGTQTQAYLATQRGFGGFRKLVMLREMLPELKGDDEAHRRFLKEVKSVAGFHQPHVAEVYDLEAADGRLLLATEFVPGATLEEVASAFRTAKMRVPVGLVTMAIRDTALALQYAHTFTNPVGDPEPVFHGNVSPGAIQMTFEGLTKVLDFGVPKPRSTGLSAATDLAALGAVIPAVLAESPQDLMLSSRPDLPAPLRTVFARLLAANPEQRFATALDFAKALDAAAAPVMWRAEQSAALIQRMFTERREEIRELLANISDTSSSTAVMPLSKIFSQGRAPKDASEPATGPHGYEIVEEGEEGTRPRAPKAQPDPEAAFDEPDGPTVIRHSGERPALGEGREESTDVRRIPVRPSQPALPAAPVLEKKEAKAPGATGAGSRALRWAFVLVLLGLGALLVTWRLRPGLIRARSPEVAKALENLAAIPGFPGHEVTPPDAREVLAILVDAGELALPPADAGPADSGEADAGTHVSQDAGVGKLPAGKSLPVQKQTKHHHGR